MAVTFKPTDPKSINYTLTVSLTLDKWQRIQASLPEKHFGAIGELHGAIDALVRQATKNFEVGDEDDEDV